MRLELIRHTWGTTGIWEVCDWMAARQADRFLQFTAKP